MYLDRFDFDESKPQVDLIAWFDGREMGVNTGADICFTVKRIDEDEGMSECLFSVSVRKLRALCDMAEAMHKMGSEQWNDGSMARMS